MVKQILTLGRVLKNVTGNVVPQLSVHKLISSIRSGNYLELVLCWLDELLQCGTATITKTMSWLLVVVLVVLAAAVIAV